MINLLKSKAMLFQYFLIKIRLGVVICPTDFTD